MSTRRRWIRPAILPLLLPFLYVASIGPYMGITCVWGEFTWDDRVPWFYRPLEWYVEEGDHPGALLLSDYVDWCYRRCIDLRLWWDPDREFQVYP